VCYQESVLKIRKADANTIKGLEDREQLLNQDLQQLKGNKNKSVMDWLDATNTARAKIEDAESEEKIPESVIKNNLIKSKELGKKSSYNSPDIFFHLDSTFKDQEFTMVHTIYTNGESSRINGGELEHSFISSGNIIFSKKLIKGTSFYKRRANSIRTFYPKHNGVYGLLGSFINHAVQPLKEVGITRYALIATIQIPVNEGRRLVSEFKLICNVKNIAICMKCNHSFKSCSPTSRFSLHNKIGCVKFKAHLHLRKSQMSDGPIILFQWVIKVKIY
jgi:hypothetical protein